MDETTMIELIGSLPEDKKKDFILFLSYLQDTEDT